VPISVGVELEASQKGVDADVGQRLRLVSFIWRIDRTRIGGVQLEDQIIHPLVLNIDLSSAFLDLAEQPVPSQYQGESLMPRVRGEAVDWR